MKAQFFVFTIFVSVSVFLSGNSYAVDLQAGPGCNIDIEESLPGYNVLNSSTGSVVETVLADSCADEHLNKVPVAYAGYCDCNKVVPSADDKQRFDKFMKRRVGLQKALDKKSELESSAETTSYLINDSLTKLHDNSIAYPESCAELMKLEEVEYNKCTSGDKLKELQSITGLTDPGKIFKKIIPTGNEKFYKDTSFDIMTYFGFGESSGERLDFNHTTNPSLASVNEVLGKNPQFGVAKEVIGPAVGTVLDKYDVKLSELFHNPEFDSTSNMINNVAGDVSREFISNINQPNAAKVLLAVAHEYFGEGDFNPHSLGVTVKLRVKAMEYAILKNRKGSDVLNEAITSAQYMKSPIFLETYLKKMMDKVRTKVDPSGEKSEKEISEELKDKKISTFLTDAERKDLYQNSVSDLFYKVIKNFKDLGALCTDYRVNFDLVCGDNLFDDEKYDGADFLSHAMAFNPKGTGVKIMCDKALRYLRDESASTDGDSVELSETGFLGYLQHLGGVKVEEGPVSGMGPILTTTRGPNNPQVGSFDSQSGPSPSYEIFRGLQVTSGLRVPPGGNIAGAGGSGATGTNDPNSNPSGGIAGGNTVSYQITNFSAPDNDRRMLVDAIIKNDEKEIRTVISSRFNDSGKIKPVFANDNPSKTSAFDSASPEALQSEIDQFVSKNFALYDDNDSNKSIDTNFYTPENSIFGNNNGGLFNAGNVPTTPVDFDDLSDEQKKEYNDAVSELDEKIEEGEELVDKGEKTLEEKEDDKEKTALQKQLDELRKSIDQLKKQKKGLEASVIQNREDIRVKDKPAPKRVPSSIDDKKYVTNVPSGSSSRAANVRSTTPSFSGNTYSGGGGSGGGSISTGADTAGVAYVDGSNGYSGTIVANGNQVGKETTKKNPGPKSGPETAVNFDKVILERTSVVLAPDVFSSYGQEQFEQYYRDHGSDPIVVKKQIEVVISGKTEMKDVYVYYFPEMKDGKINYVKRDPGAVMSALQTVKSKKKVDTQLDITQREIARHNELVKLFKQVTD